MRSFTLAVAALLAGSAVASAQHMQTTGTNQSPPPEHSRWSSTNSYASSWGTHNAAGCFEGLEKLKKNTAYQSALRTCNTNPTECDKTALLDACHANSLGHMCSISYSLTGNNTRSRFVQYQCVPVQCPSPSDTDLAVKKLEAGYTYAHVSSTCEMNPTTHPYRYTRLNNGGGGLNEIIQLAWFIGMLIFCASEKSRRWGRMQSLWPSAAAGRGRGNFRVSLCDCWGCTRTCFAACCCTPALVLFNRAELDHRQWSWCDVCCMTYHCTIAYHNRQAIRQRLDAQQRPCADCCTICWCAPCAIAQHTLEIEKGLPATVTPVGGNGAPATGPAAPAHMVQMTPVGPGGVVAGQAIAVAQPATGMPVAPQQVHVAYGVPTAAPVAYAPAGAYPPVSAAYTTTGGATATTAATTALPPLPTDGYGYDMTSVNKQ